MEGQSLPTKRPVYAKLLEFQKLGISLKKSETNPHFKSKYADISEVLEKIKKPLSELGLVISQIPDKDGLRTIIIDSESGDYIEGYLEFSQKQDPQKLGSNITYYRRYSLVAMLGLEDEDEDGNQAQAKAAPAVKAPAPKKVEITQEQAMTMLAQAKSQDELKKIWVSLSAALRKDPEVEAMKDERKEYLTNQETA